MQAETSSAGTMADYQSGVWDSFGSGFSLASVLHTDSALDTTTQNSLQSTNISGSSGAATAVESVGAFRYDSKNEYEAGSYSNSSYALSSYTADQSTNIGESVAQHQVMTGTATTIQYDGLDATTTEIATHVGAVYANGSFSIGSYAYTGQSLESHALRCTIRARRRSPTGIIVRRT